MKRTKYTPNDFIIEGNICKISCYDLFCKFKGFAIIDLDDMERCKQYKWCIDSHNYVMDSKNNKLHNFILNIKPPIRSDHKNRNSLDCRKENLRICTHAENNYNQGLKQNNTSGYKGVSWDRGKWTARITKCGKLYLLGAFDNKEEAALAYNKKAIELFGEFAFLNVVKLVLIKRKLL